MLASGGAMEHRRKDGEEEACVFVRQCAPAATATNAAAGLSGGTATSNGSARAFDAIVTRIWSANQILVVDKESGKERRV